MQADKLKHKCHHVRKKFMTFATMQFFLIYNDDRSFYIIGWHQQKTTLRHKNNKMKIKNLNMKHFSF